MATGRHQTASLPLGLAYLGLIVYASLFPFEGWRDQGYMPLSFLWAPWPRYWTGFDLVSNLLGYMPAGFLLALTALRTGRGRYAVAWATLACTVLSLGMECLQNYLPRRVPSNVDFALNTAGAWVGAVAAALLERMGAIARWNRLRARWFVADAQGALVLLALWPAALLFPAAVPLGLGQVLERVEDTLAELLADTPFLEWLPVRDVELQPLVPAAEFLCVVLGALIPCLVAYCVVRQRRHRLGIALGVVLTGILGTAFSATMTFGPAHAWEWMRPAVLVALVAATALSLLLLRVPRRGCAALALLAMGIYLSVLNQAPLDPYFSQTLLTWEQGRFIRFHGLAQWLGWLWPYAALVYLVARLWGSDKGDPAPAPGSAQT